MRWVRYVAHRIMLGKMGRNVDVKEPGWVVVDWMYLSHSKNQWWAVLNEIMNVCSMDSTS